MRELNDEQKRQIHALRNLPQRDIARRVGVGLGSVSKTLAAPPPAKSKRDKRRKAPLASPPSAAKPRPAPAAPEHGADDTGEAMPVEARLRRSLAALERAADLAAGDRDVARMVSVQKAIAGVTALAARLAPPPTVDPNTNPDLVKAAQTFRTRVFEKLDRLIAEAKGAP